MSCDSASAFALVPLAGEPEAPYGPGRDPHEPSDLELRVYTREELVRLFHGGEREADEAEARLVEAARARGGLWLRIGQGLRALKKGRRLQALAFRFPDYAREIGIGRSRGCKFHHTCIHAAGLRLQGEAPDALVWTLDGEPFTGR